MSNHYPNYSRPGDPNTPYRSPYSCPRCGGTNVNYQFINTGTIGASTNRVVVEPAKQSKGCLYWALIGWWWRPFYWIFIGWWWTLLFGGRSKSGLNVNANKVINQKMAICQNCGYSWKAQ